MSGAADINDDEDEDDEISVLADRYVSDDEWVDSDIEIAEAVV
jgi:hypothetical protein